jgi:dihydrofolate reductase
MPHWPDSTGRGRAVSWRDSAARSLAVVDYVSLDGVIQAPGHAGEDRDGGFPHGGWSSSTAEFMADHRRYNSQLFPTAGAFLLGRRTYEIFAAYWPTVTDERDQIA